MFNWANGLWTVLMFLIFVVISILAYGAITALISAFGGVIIFPIVVLVIVFFVGALT